MNTCYDLALHNVDYLSDGSLHTATIAQSYSANKATCAQRGPWPESQGSEPTAGAFQGLLSSIIKNPESNKTGALGDTVQQGK